MYGHFNIRDAQQADPSISRLFNLKVNNKPKPSARQFRNEPYFRKMLRHYDRLFIHDEILVRAIGKSRLQFAPALRYCYPAHAYHYMC